MSGRVRKQSDCPAGKQGPMRATLPVSSIMKQTGLRNSCGNSPTLSPTNAWRHISPENHSLSGQRSPGALNYKGRSRYGSGNAIRRTASLDTLYQKGQWPRDFYLHGGLLQIDKASQTDDGNSDSTGNICGRTSSSSDDDKLEKYLRQRLQRTPNKAHAQEHSSQTMSPVFGGVAGGWMRYAGSGGAPLRAARSSVEGLNQEIERLVLSSNVPHLDNRHKVTPEGHRAPLADMLRRSVNTQTPHELTYTHSSGCSSRESLSSGCSPERLMPGGSVCSSPDAEGGRLGTSPQINRFLAREPPHGCEKVKLKSNNEAFATHQLLMPSGDPAACPVVKPGGGFLLRPSAGSAFYPLQPPLPLYQPPHTHQEFDGEPPQARKALHFPPGFKPEDE